MSFKFENAKLGELTWHSEKRSSDCRTPWWSTDECFNVTTSYGGVCGRVIATDTSFCTHIQDYGNDDDQEPFLDLRCRLKTDYYSDIRPFEEEKSCTQCLVLYAELLKNFAQARKKAIRMIRNKINARKPKRKPGKKRKLDLLNEFERDQLRQMKRLAGKDLQARLPMGLDI